MALRLDEATQCTDRHFFRGFRGQKNHALAVSMNKTLKYGRYLNKWRPKNEIGSRDFSVCFLHNLSEQILALGMNLSHSTRVVNTANRRSIFLLLTRHSVYSIYIYAKQSEVAATCLVGKIIIREKERRDLVARLLDLNSLQTTGRRRRLSLICMTDPIIPEQIYTRRELFQSKSRVLRYQNKTGPISSIWPNRNFVVGRLCGCL